jgi:hypothetical protein
MAQWRYELSQVRKKKKQKKTLKSKEKEKEKENNRRKGGRAKVARAQYREVTMRHIKE